MQQLRAEDKRIWTANEAWIFNSEKSYIAGKSPNQNICQMNLTQCVINCQVTRCSGDADKHSSMKNDKI